VVHGAGFGIFCARGFTNFWGVAELGPSFAGGGILLLCAATLLSCRPPESCSPNRKLEPLQLPTPFQGTWLRSVTRKSSSETVMAVHSGRCWCGIVPVQVPPAEIQYGRHPVHRVKYDLHLLNLQGPKGLESVGSAGAPPFSKRPNGFAACMRFSMTDSAQSARLLNENFLGIWPAFPT